MLRSLILSRDFRNKFIALSRPTNLWMEPHFSTRMTLFRDMAAFGW